MSREKERDILAERRHSQVAASPRKEVAAALTQNPNDQHLQQRGKEQLREEKHQLRDKEYQLRDQLRDERHLRNPELHLLRYQGAALLL